MSSPLTTQTVFYSWQSDLPNRTNRTFIEEALKTAIDGLETELEVDLILDQDAANTPGAPDIAQTILSKIDRAIAIVADVSIINQGSGGRPTPNPNVLFELGYAVRALSWENILPVFNLATGRIEDLPFDLRPRRPITYTMTEEAVDKASERRDLSRSLQKALTLIIEGSEERMAKNPRLSLDAEILRSRSQIIFKIKNDSNGLARAPYLSFTMPERFEMALHGIDGNGNHGSLGPPHGGSDHRNPRFGGKTDIVIHPHTTVDVARIVFVGSANAYPSGDILIDYELRAEGAPSLNSRMTINNEGVIS
jgi:hypothetical protein